MNEPQKQEDPFVVGNGVDGETGRYLLPPISSEELGHLVANLEPDEEFVRKLTNWRSGRKEGDPLRAPSVDIDDPNNFAETGWAVVFAEDTPSEVRRALEPLLETRRDQAKDLYQELTCSSGITKRKFLLSVNAKSGAPVLPDQLPYYLMLVGDPRSIPFRFQSELDVRYAVGRVHFDAKEGTTVAARYRAYADAVAAASEGVPLRAKGLTFFSVRNPQDPGTERLSGELVDPLSDVIIKSRPAWKSTISTMTDPTRDSLRRYFVGAECRSLLFTASHGVGFNKGDDRQFESQGGLVCQDWAGPPNGISRDQYFTAADVPDEANLRGLIAFHFACYSAGTPQFDEFGQLAGVRGEIADHPFIARLPQKLMEKGALAVVGHVDRAWTSSFSWNDAGGHVQVYSNLLKQLTDNYPIGWAMESMGDYFGDQAAELHGMREDLGNFGPEDFATYADLWRETNDARNFVVLGDPAVRLNFD
jgi:hypothetical protein